MNIKKYLVLTPLVILSCCFSSSFGQLVGGESFLQGQFLEVGVSSCGSYGTAVAAPAGYHPTNTGMGFVADPDMDGWDMGSPNHCGDYFLPGNPVEGWGIEIAGTTWANGNDGTICSNDDIPGTNTTWSDAGGVLTNIWEGSISVGLDVRQTTFFPEDALYFVTQVQLCNTSPDTLFDVYYFRSVDPDNDQPWPGGSFTTTNQIISNPPTDNEALVTAEGPLGCFLGLGARDTMARATYGLIVTMPDDGSDIWNGVSPFNLSGINVADENVSLAFYIPFLPPGECTCVAMAYILNEDDLEEALDATTGTGVFADGEDITSTLTTTICNTGDSVTLELFGVVDDYEFTWTPDIDLSADTGSTVIAFPDTTTIYHVIGISDDCFDIELDITVVVDTTAEAEAGDDVIVCSGQPGQLMGSGGVSYLWTPADGLTDDDVPDPEVLVFDTTLYYLEITNENGCPATDSVWVFLDDAPDISVSSGGLICEGDSIQISGIGGVTFEWLPVDGLSDAGSATTYASPAATTTYTYVAIGENDCTSEEDIVITVGPSYIALASEDDTICGGGSVVLTVTGGDYFQWDPPTGLDDPNSDSPTASPTGTTTYTVSDTSQCATADEVTVFVFSAPAVLAGSDMELCVGSTIILDATGGVSYTWDPEDGLSDPNIAGPVAGPDGTTTYTVTAIDENGCVGTDDITITVNPVPSADAGFDVTINIAEGESTTLNASGGIMYSWSPTDGLSDPNIANPVAMPTDTTTYYVTVIDENGCSSLDSVTVNVIGPLVIALPTAFSPNSDGINDFYAPIVRGYGDLVDYTIYNRWGEVVYSSTSLTPGWSGVFDGKEQEIGGYVVVVRVDVKGEIQMENGSFTLVR